MVTYEGVRSSREFGEIHRRFRRFALPTVLGVLGWYFLYVVLAAFFPDLMAVRVVGEINIGLCFGALQFVSTFAVTALYLRWARTSLDPMVDQLRGRLERGGLR
ncbi:MAG TPA: DUF485 domain-containing protein [Kineosporiaceae bacterium]